MDALAGPALLLLQNCKDDLTYANLLERLQRRYGSDHLKDNYRRELKHRRQKNTESLQEFCSELENMAALAHPGLAADTREVEVTLPAFLEVRRIRN